jgi:hypothetical protein
MLRLQAAGGVGRDGHPATSTSPCRGWSQLAYRRRSAGQAPTPPCVRGTRSGCACRRHRGSLARGPTPEVNVGCPRRPGPSCWPRWISAFARSCSRCVRMNPGGAKAIEVAETSSRRRRSCRRGDGHGRRAAPNRNRRALPSCSHHPGRRGRRGWHGQRHRGQPARSWRHGAASVWPCRLAVASAASRPTARRRWLVTSWMIRSPRAAVCSHALGGRPDRVEDATGRVAGGRVAVALAGSLPSLPPPRRRPASARRSGDRRGDQQPHPRPGRCGRGRWRLGLVRRNQAADRSLEPAAARGDRRRHLLSRQLLGCTQRPRRADRRPEASSWPRRPRSLGMPAALTASTLPVIAAVAGG